MKKQLLSFIFAICLIIPAAFMLSACGTKENEPAKPKEPATSTIQSVGGVEYDLISDGTAYKVIDCVRSRENVDILPILNNKPVTIIGESAFEDCEDLISVTIPNSITEICAKAFFGCESLQSVSTGEGVITIGEKAFHMCDSLVSVILGNNVKTIGNYAFDCDIETLVWGNSVETIGEQAFSGCNLESTIIPNSVKSIGSGAFFGSSLKSVVIGDGVISIGSLAFSDCWNLKNVVIGNNVQTIGIGAFSNCAISEITIPSSVITIEDAAFTYDGIKKVIIDSESISNNLIENEDQGCLLWDYYEKEINAETVYIKTGLRVTNSTLLLENFTKQATSDKSGYDMYVRNAE